MTDESLPLSVARFPLPASRCPSPASSVSTEERTGAQVMCEALVRENVEVMFGIPGGAIMPFYHAMWEYRDQIRHVLCRHEQGAGHAAEGYARSTGKPGVCVATSGPGATNLVTPIANAWMDSTPLVAITGQVSSAVLGKDAFQETDITGITLPITKHNYRVTRAEDLPSAGYGKEYADIIPVHGSGLDDNDRRCDPSHPPLSCRTSPPQGGRSAVFLSALPLQR